MSSYLELMAPTRIGPNDGSTTYYQSVEDLPDVSGHTEGAFVATVQNLEGSGTARVALETALDRHADYFMECGAGAGIAEFAGLPGTDDYPQQRYAYFGGASDASGTPGFGRYVRVKVEFGSVNDHMTLGVRAVLKP